MLFRFSPARRRQIPPVCAQISTIEPRTLLSGNAIFPQPASAAPQAAAPSNFAGLWDFAVDEDANFHVLSLNQTGSVVSGTFGYEIGGTTYALPINEGSVKGKKMTLEATGEVDFVMKVKLQSENSFKGKVKIVDGPKSSAHGIRS